MKSAIQRGAANRSEHDPRTAALRIIDSVLTGKEPSQSVLDKALRDSHLVPSDKGLCTELVYGYLRNAIRLDWNLRRSLQKPEKLPGEMLLILGLAAYELGHLRIPAHASVNWAVTRVRNRFGKGLAGVVNSVLRAFAREAGTYRDESRYAGIADRIERLAVMHSLPAWVARLWLAAFDEDTALAYMRASCSRAVRAVRVNAAREDAASVRETILAEGNGAPVADWGAAFPDGAPYGAKALVKKGALSFQSAGVQELLHVLEMPSWPGPIWDACAGSGGKTTAMLERGLAVRVASDLSPHRIDRLGEELQRLHLPVPGGHGVGPEILVADAASPPAEIQAQVFATILIDAPCSGLGTLSRRPEIRFRRTGESVAGLIKTQDAILDSAARLLLPGGRIVYLTCTVNPAENEERVQAFLARNTGFALRKSWATSPDSPWHEFFYGAVLCFEK